MSRARDLARFANNQALSVSSDLNVGINSTSPDGKLDVIGDVDISRIVTASSFSGDGSELTGVISGVELQFGGSSVGTAVTNINFVGFSSVTAPVSGLSTITTAQTLTVGMRAGAAVTFSITGSSFNVSNRAGGNTVINI